MIVNFSKIFIIKKKDSLIYKIYVFIQSSWKDFTLEDRII